MWFGKVAIIMYLFSISLLFTGYYLDEVFQQDQFTGASFAALDEIAGKNTVNESISSELIFGDFIAGAKVLFGVVTAEPITQAFHLLPGFNAEWDLLVRLIFSLSSIFLWIYIITGRSI